jgi:hypothetical protein
MIAGAMSIISPTSSRGNWGRKAADVARGPARCQRREALLQTASDEVAIRLPSDVTDKLRSYGVARRQLIPSIEHRQAENVQHRKAAVEALGLARNLTITSLYRLLSPPATRRSYESQ